MTLSPSIAQAERGSCEPALAAVRAGGARAALGVAVIAALLSACGGEVEKQVAFDDREHAAYLAKGTASIEGEGFLRRPNGWLARCSGGVVFLVPATGYFREWVEVYRAGNRIAQSKELNEAHGKAIRKTQCDMQGRFRFADLPAGKWILVTRVTYDGAEWTNDSTLVSEVETLKGEAAKAILSNPNRI
jgi:hypothetical protein